ncbi:hypothetical protein ACQZ48_15440 [Agrobacterium sp. 22-209-1]
MAPSNELRTSFSHMPSRFTKCARHYDAEFSARRATLLSYGAGSLSPATRSMGQTQWRA